MAEEHVSRGVMHRFFRSELSGRDSHEIVRHLMKRCPACLAVAVDVGAEEGYVYQEGDFQSALFPEDPERYNAVFLRLLGSAEEAEMEIARERLRGIGLWHTLEKHGQPARLEQIREDPRMHTWGLYDRLLEKCRENGFRAPALAADIALLALAVVEMLDPARYGAARLADFRAGALGALGNARRLASDLAEAEEILKRLWFDLQDPASAHELTLVSLDLAEVYVARGKHEEALELVEELVPLLQGWGMHTEGLALWLLMQKAVRERRAESALFRQMAEYMSRAWYRPIRSQEN